MAYLTLPRKNGNPLYKGDKCNKFFKTSNYSNLNAVENVINDITRNREDEKYQSSLFYFGGIGVRDYADANAMINDFLYVQNDYRINSRGGRRIYHEVLWLSNEEVIFFSAFPGILVELGYRCSQIFYNNGHQVVFAIHVDSDSGKVHIHFAVNSVNYSTGLKFHSFMRDLIEREKVFNSIINEFMNGGLL